MTFMYDASKQSEVQPDISLDTSNWRAVPNHSRTCSGLASPSKDRCSTSTIAPPNRASSIARSSTACRSAQDAVMLGSGINAKDRGIGLGLVPSFERQPKRLPFQEAASNEGSRTRSAPAPITREQCRNASFGHSHGRRSRRPSPMLKPRGKKRPSKRVLALPDLEQSKAAVLNSLTSKSSQRTYDGAITNFVEWYCSEPRP